MGESASQFSKTCSVEIAGGEIFAKGLDFELVSSFNSGDKRDHPLNSAQQHLVKQLRIPGTTLARCPRACEALRFRHSSSPGRPLLPILGRY